MTLTSLFLFLFLTLHKVSNEIIPINPIKAEASDPFAPSKNIISGTGSNNSISGTGSQNSISGYGGANSNIYSNPSRAGLLMFGRNSGTNSNTNNGAYNGLDFPSPIGLYNLSGVASRFLYVLQVIAVPILALIVMVAAWKILVGATSGKSDTLKSGFKLIGYAALYFAILLVASGIPYVIKQILGF